MEVSLDVINGLVQNFVLSTDPFLVLALFGGIYLLVSFWDPCLKSQNTFTWPQ